MPEQCFTDAAPTRLGENSEILDKSTGPALRDAEKPVAPIHSKEAKGGIEFRVVAELLPPGLEASANAGVISDSWPTAGRGRLAHPLEEARGHLRCPAIAALPAPN